MGAPAPTECVDLTMEDGAVVRLRRHGRAGGVRLVLSHGNGFAIGGYQAFWSLLTDRFDVILFDLRDHGENPRFTRAGHRLDGFVRDFATIRRGLDEAFGAVPCHGVFHSISAIGAILANERLGVAWESLALVDPPLSVPEDHPLRTTQARLDDMLADWAAGRPERFASLDAYASELAASRVYARCVAGAAAAMAAATTRAGPEGVELACPGAFESAIYRDNRDCGSFESLGRMAQPVFLIGADADAPDARPPALVSREAARSFGLPYVAVAGTSHFLQIERPRAVVNALLSVLNSHGGVAP